MQTPEQLLRNWLERASPATVSGVRPVNSWPVRERPTAGQIPFAISSRLAGGGEPARHVGVCDRWHVTGWQAESRGGRRVAMDDVIAGGGALVRDTVERVVIQRGQVQIIRKPAATSAAAAANAVGDVPKVHAASLPAPRPRARKEIILPGVRDSSPRRLNHALILAIARAKSWMRDLRGGKYADTMDIARQFQLSDAHVRRILRFGYLAPDIVEAIVKGRQPCSMTVKRLLQGIPCVWADQRAAFGFAR